jgi:hypothetical protein
MVNDMDRLYASFARVWADGHPVRSEAELEAAARAAGVEPSTASDDWLRSLSRAWVYYEAEDPFDDEQVNRAYHRRLRELLA